MRLYALVYNLAFNCVAPLTRLRGWGGGAAQGHATLLGLITFHFSCSFFGKKHKIVHIFTDWYVDGGEGCTRVGKKLPITDKRILICH